jgi:hypothetical protein
MRRFNFEGSRECGNVTALLLSKEELATDGPKETRLLCVVAPSITDQPQAFQNILGRYYLILYNCRKESSGGWVVGVMNKCNAN